MEGTNKQHVQEVVHAVEELYFFHQYQEAADLAGKVLKESRGLDCVDDFLYVLLVCALHDRTDVLVDLSRSLAGDDHETVQTSNT